MIVGVGWRGGQGKARPERVRGRGGRAYFRKYGLAIGEERKEGLVGHVRERQMEEWQSKQREVVEKRQNKELLGRERGGRDGGGGKQRAELDIPHSLLPAHGIYACFWFSGIPVRPAHLFPCRLLFLLSSPCYFLCCMQGGRGGIVPSRLVCVW